MEKIRFDLNGKLVEAKIKNRNGRHSGRKCVIAENGEYLYYLPVKLKGIEILAK